MEYFLGHWFSRINERILKSPSVEKGFTFTFIYLYIHIIFILHFYRNQEKILKMKLPLVSNLHTYLQGMFYFDSAIGEYTEK